jgi:hydrogenase maturation protein HypF
VRAAAADILAGVPAPVVAARFHRGVAGMIGEVCHALRDAGAGPVVGLTGGVFQNVLLVESTLETLERNGFEVLLHRIVPPNDGGLALGQAVLAGTG